MDSEINVYGKLKSQFRLDCTDCFFLYFSRKDDFIQNHVLKNSEERVYLAQHTLFDQIEKLRQGIYVPGINFHVLL